ncbi:thiazole tautomerase TenI [Evansella sp. AB-P1]|uniref:thiazole tautomerase TenI n=1 Tax=Evansella sp. AB-P1 TaxID=3037653 RepID=UPI00241CE801|nr:thiazole tautomerase TenI [Evansella sp. AB-P1]MDG5786054.1 thiazole tautomerase TenI [Evansella sp. AB-P1]
MSNNIEIHVISNGKLSLNEFAEKATIIDPYVSYFHIREKERSAKELVEGVKLLVHAGIPLSKIIINDRVDVAVAMKTVGVQLAYHSLATQQVQSTFPKLRVGQSVHSIEEAQEAERAGADYVLFGHIFPSKSKPDLQPRGTGVLKEMTELINIPVIALGGIDPNNVNEIVDSGANGFAIMSGILEAEEPLSMIKSYVNRGNKE